MFAMLYVSPTVLDPAKVVKTIVLTKRSLDAKENYRAPYPVA